MGLDQSYRWEIVTATRVRCTAAMSWPDWRLRSGNGQQARDALAANVVDTRKDNVVALDLDDNGRIQPLAVEFPERHREIGRMAIPADGEVGAECHLSRALRSTD